MEYGLIGERLSHSHSPQIHRMLGDYAYELMPMPPEEIEGFLTRADFKGINITIPYKRTVIPFCRTLDRFAERTGSVNTIVKDKDGLLHGFNTDYSGFLFMARRAGISFKGEKVLIFGSGGTGHTAQAVAEDEGALSVVTVSRTGPDNYENLARHRDSTLIINTTPVGMFPKNSDSLINLSRFPLLRGVIDVVYNPLSTRLILQAKELGLACTGGFPMLVAQGVFASGHFQNREFSDVVIEDVTERMTGMLSNLVLIGMPGSGKTTFARLAAEKLGRVMIDIDDAIEKKAGMGIQEIFEKQGEASFRLLEKDVIEETGRLNGLVIATGGGCVLLRENGLNLKQNGVLIYLDRETNDLAIDGRPLSTDLETLAFMRRHREPLYNKFADFTVKNNSDEKEVLFRILDAFGGAK